MCQITPLSTFHIKRRCSGEGFGTFFGNWRSQSEKPSKIEEVKSENTEISLKPHLFNLGPIPNWTTSGSMNGLNMEPVLCNWKKSILKSNISKKVCT